MANYSTRKRLCGGGPPNTTMKRVCVLHNSTSTYDNDDHFTPFSNVKTNADDKLSFLLDIRNRRLAEPSDSNNRMKAACDSLPNNLDGIDLDCTGYHRHCYQRFTSNLRRLKNSPKNDASTSKPRSPRKRKSLEGSSRLFPRECIFCDKLEIQVGRKTERTINSCHGRKKCHLGKA